MKKGVMFTRLMSIAMIAIVSVGFVSCGDDDNPTTVIKDNGEERNDTNTLDAFSIKGVWVCNTNAGDKIISIGLDKNEYKFSYTAIPANEDIVFFYLEPELQYDDETGNVILKSFDRIDAEEGDTMYDARYPDCQKDWDNYQRYLIPDNLKLPGSSFVITKISNDKISIGSDVYCKHKSITCENFRNSNWNGYTFWTSLSGVKSIPYPYYEGHYDIRFNNSDEMEFMNTDNDRVHYMLTSSLLPQWNCNDNPSWFYGWSCKWINREAEADEDLGLILVDFLTSNIAHFVLVIEHESLRQATYGLMFRLS